MDLRQSLILAKLKKAKARKQQQQQQYSGNIGTPDYVEETHEDMSWADRAAVKNFGNDIDSSIGYLQKQNPNLEFKRNGDRILIKRPNERQYKVLDPDTGFFSTDILEDATDIAYDVGAGATEGIAGLAAGIGTANPAIGFGAAAGLGYGFESARQGIGQAMGVNDSVDYMDAGIVGAISGVAPFAPGLAQSAGKSAANTLKGGAKKGVKFVTGVTDDQIKGYKKDIAQRAAGARGFIKEAEEDGMVAKLKAKSDALARLAEESNERLGRKVKEVEEGLNFADDADYENVLKAEIDAIENKAIKSGQRMEAGDRKRLAQLQSALGGKDDIMPVRQALVEDSGLEGGALRETAFPESMSIEDAMEIMPNEMKTAFGDIYDDISKQFNTIEGDIPTEVIYREFENAINGAKSKIPGTNLSTEDTEGLAMILAKDMQERFMLNNKGNVREITERVAGGKQSALNDGTLTMPGQSSYKLAMGQASSGLGEGAGKVGSSTRVTRVANQNTSDALKGQSISLDDYLPLPKTVPFETASRLKNKMAEAAKYNGNPLSAGINPKQAEPLAKFYRKAERAFADEMDKATQGATSEARASYKKLKELQTFAKRFDTPEKTSTTLSQALKDTPKGEYIRRQMREIDTIAGTNYADAIEATVKAEKLTKQGLDARKAFDGSSEYINKTAKELSGEADNEILNRMAQAGGTPDKLAGTLGALKQGSSYELNEAAEHITKKYGPKAGEDFVKMIEEIDTVNFFADPKNVKLFGQGGRKQAASDFDSAARGGGGALGWGTAGSAYAAQVGSQAGKKFAGVLPKSAIAKAAIESSEAITKRLSKFDKATQRAMKVRLQDVLERRLDGRGQLLNNLKMSELMREGIKTGSELSDDRS